MILNQIMVIGVLVTMIDRHHILFNVEVYHSAISICNSWCTTGLAVRIWVSTYSFQSLRWCLAEHNRESGDDIGEQVER